MNDGIPLPYVKQLICMNDVALQEHIVNLSSTNFQRIWWFHGLNAKIRRGGASGESKRFFVSNLSQLRRLKLPNISFSVKFTTLKKINSVVIIPRRVNSMTCQLNSLFLNYFLTPVYQRTIVIFARKIRDAKFDAHIAGPHSDSRHLFDKNKSARLHQHKTNTEKIGCFFRLKWVKIMIISSRRIKFKGKLTKPSLNTSWIFSYI